MGEVKADYTATVCCTHRVTNNAIITGYTYELGGQLIMDELNLNFSVRAWYMGAFTQFNDLNTDNVQCGF